MQHVSRMFNINKPQCNQCYDIGSVCHVKKIKDEEFLIFNSCMCAARDKAHANDNNFWNGKRLTADIPALDLIKKHNFPKHIEQAVRVWRNKDIDAIIKTELSQTSEKFLTKGFNDSLTFVGNLFARNSIFSVVNDKYKNKTYKIKDNVYCPIIQETRVFRVTNDVKCVIDQPVLSVYDAKVLGVLKKIYNKSRNHGLTLFTSYNEITRELSYIKNAGSAAIETIKHALIRLEKTSFYFEYYKTDKEGNSEKEKSITYGILTFKSVEKTKNNKMIRDGLEIHFDPFVFIEYLDNEFAKFNPKAIADIGDYAYLLFNICYSHEGLRNYNLSTLRKMLKIDEKILDKKFKYQINEAIKELKTKKMVTDETGFYNSNNLVDGKFEDQLRLEFARNIKEIVCQKDEIEAVNYKPLKMVRKKKDKVNSEEKID